MLNGILWDKKMYNEVKIEIYKSIVKRLMIPYMEFKCQIKI